MNPAACTLDVVVAVQAAVMAKGGSMTSAITATGLRKSFGGTAVLDGIDLEVGAGTTFSLLGPNGVGKTTTVQIMSTRVHADGGEVRVAGHDVAVGSAGGTGRDRGHRPVLRGRQPVHRRGEPAAVNAWPVRAAAALQRSDRAGRLGDCRLRTSAGNFWLEQSGPLRLKTGFGHRYRRQHRGQRRDLHRLRQDPDPRDRGHRRGQEL